MEVEDRRLGDHASSLMDEAIVAELSETIELQASKLQALREEVECVRAERNQLSCELHMARAWIRELAAELQRTSPSGEPATTTLRERIHDAPS